MQITPYVYQKTAMQLGLKGLRGSMKRALVVLATGLGKTFTAAFITKAFRPRRALFLVHNNFILQHAMDEFRLVFGEKTRMALYNGMSKDGATEAEIVFATWQTMNQSLKEWAPNYFDLIIVDEAHHTEADTYKPVVKYFKGAKLGITATPDRGDKKDIRGIFGPAVIHITLEEAIARGWAPPVEYHIVTDESLDEDALQKIAAEIREGKKRFTMAEVNRRIFIRKRDIEVARIINGYNEKALVFCASIDHANRMARFLECGTTFHSAKGNGQKDTWNKNQVVLDDFKNGLVRRVCAVNAFNEGVNVPSVGLVAFCRVTDLLSIFLQQLGRGLRQGKDKLIALDFVGNLERIRLVLEMMNRIADLHEKYTPVKERACEGYIRQRFEVSGKGFQFTFSDKMVDLIEILEHCERDFYSTWQEAAEATAKLGIITWQQYRTRYKEDQKLPSIPNRLYKDFPGWIKFFGKQPKKFYSTWQQASRAAIRLGIRSQSEYHKNHRRDKRLPSNPHIIYPNFPGSIRFYGKQVKEFYSTWEQASRATARLGIDSYKEYVARYKEDKFLPSLPRTYYPNFPGWHVFFSNH